LPSAAQQLDAAIPYDVACHQFPVHGTACIHAKTVPDGFLPHLFSLRLILIIENILPNPYHINMLQDGHQQLTDEAPIDGIHDKNNGTQYL